MLLEQANVVGTPGVGFGPSGEGYFRLTAFGDREETIEAVERINKVNIKFTNGKITNGKITNGKIKKNY